MRFLRRAPGLAVVAQLAGGHDVLPIVATPTMAREDVVQRQVSRLLSAVLTSEVIAQEDVPAGKASSWPGSSDEVDQPDYGRNLKDGGWTVEVATPVLNDLGLPAVHQDKSAPDVAHVQRLVILV